MQLNDSDHNHAIYVHLFKDIVTKLWNVVNSFTPTLLAVLLLVSRMSCDTVLSAISIIIITSQCVHT